MINYTGLILGICVFLIIGIFHPIVIKAEYYMGTKIWPVFLILGIACLGISLRIQNLILSGLLGTLGFTFLWSIQELFEQAKRVRKGWFPENPKKVKK